MTNSNWLFERFWAAAGGNTEKYGNKPDFTGRGEFACPGLSDAGRIRVDTKAVIKYELIKNLYLNFSAYLNYDSNPPRPTSKSDYGASSSVGWSF